MVAMLRVLLLLLVVAAGVAAVDRALALDGAPDAPALSTFSAQDGAAPGADTRVPVQLWTVLAAGGALALGLLFFLVRLVMGWVQPPPPREEGSGH
jgi:hypothetical protein